MANVTAGILDLEVRQGELINDTETFG